MHEELPQARALLLQCLKEQTELLNKINNRSYMAIANDDDLHYANQFMKQFRRDLVATEDMLAHCDTCSYCNKNRDLFDKLELVLRELISKTNSLISDYKHRQSNVRKVSSKEDWKSIDLSDLNLAIS